MAPSETAVDVASAANFIIVKVLKAKRYGAFDGPAISRQISGEAEGWTIDPRDGLWLQQFAEYLKP